jgi:hypothetical protein
MADRVKWDRSWGNAVLLFTRQSPGRERTANIAQDGVPQRQPIRLLAVTPTWQHGRDTTGELGVTESAVVQAKYRIHKRLCEEAGELLD